MENIITKNLPYGFSMHYSCGRKDVGASFDLLVNGVRVASGDDVNNPELNFFYSRKHKDYLTSIIDEKINKDAEDEARESSEFLNKMILHNEAVAAAAEQAIEDHLAGNVRAPEDVIPEVDAFWRDRIRAWRLSVSEFKTIKGFSEWMNDGSGKTFEIPGQIQDVR